LLHGIWAEVRTLVIGEVEGPNLDHGEPRKVKAETFDRLALVETILAGVIEVAWDVFHAAFIYFFARRFLISG